MEWSFRLRCPYQEYIFPTYITLSIYGHPVIAGGKFIASHSEFQNDLSVDCQELVNGTVYNRSYSPSVVFHTQWNVLLREILYRSCCHFKRSSDVKILYVEKLEDYASVALKSKKLVKVLNSSLEEHCRMFILKLAQVVYLQNGNQNNTQRPLLDQFKTKLILTVFFDNEDVVHHALIPAGQTVNGSLYMQVWKRQKEAIQRKGPAQWQEGWSLHLDNDPSPSLIVYRHDSRKKNHSIPPPASIRIRFSTIIFPIFSDIKMGLKGNRFDTVEDIKIYMMAKLWKIP
ncbi:mariner Mos1 transposase [Nephila pilipes]|uniref:Mariner Mos1 transposase n=1 Tax=Nephila pilipes TaxID=299642 RepID=A0A8X6K0E1_NEPPI|nr:mariner Mos1 transposase [Nephila pilipes]